MRRVPRAAETRGVDTPVHHTLTLEVEAEHGSIHGRLVDGAGGSVDFGGWLGLVSALGRYIDGDASAEAGASGDTRERLPR